MLITLLLLSGLALLAVGGELLVRGSVTTAQHVGVSPLLIGIVLIGFGTSTPELITSIAAARLGSPDIAYGNIVGSNTANLLLVIGAAALVRPLRVTSVALKRDGVLMLAVCALFIGLAVVTAMPRVVGVALVTLLLGYLLLVVRQERTGGPVGHTSAYERAEAIEELRDATVKEPAGIGNGRRQWPLLAIAFAVTGLALMVLGGNLLVDSAVKLARNLAVPEAVIGLTIVAVGTSMPELVASLVAALRGHGDVALGNVIGSCLYNILGIGGATAMISPGPIPESLVRFDLPVMLAASVLMLLFALNGRHIWRIEGAVLLGGYVGYLYVLLP